MTWYLSAPQLMPLLMLLTWLGLRPPETFCMPTVLPMSCSMGCPSRKPAAVMSMHRQHMLRVRPDWHGRRLRLYPIYTCTILLQYSVAKG